MEINSGISTLKNSIELLEETNFNNLIDMITLAQKQLNPLGYSLSFEARKRLRWLYLLYYEQDGNVTKSAKKLGITRQWLSEIKNGFEKNNKDPRTLEPKSKLPGNTENRRKISEETKTKIIKIRDDSNNVWGKKKISVVMERDYGIKVDPNTVNKYLHEYGKINPKISLKNSKAWKAKVAREHPSVELRIKYRPPKEIKDYAPGALIEKDMKYVPKYKQNLPGKAGDNFYNQHTEIDSFTRIRSLELVKDGSSLESTMAHEKSVSKFPFKIACINNDNGSENNGVFIEQLKKEDVFQFYSNVGTPTDNPRVERSHLTDEIEFYQKGGIKKTFEEQKQALADHEHRYNFSRPHQALGNLTPMVFYDLWREKPEQALVIKDKYQAYLLKQRIRLASARKIKKQEQIEALMKFIDTKLKDKQDEMKNSKLQLINCQLCSVA